MYILKKELDKITKINNELKLLILKMMYKINIFEKQENNRYSEYFVKK
jgi:hypothetical protein